MSEISLFSQLLNLSHIGKDFSHVPEKSSWITADFFPFLFRSLLIMLEKLLNLIVSPKICGKPTDFHRIKTEAAHRMR